MKNKFVFFIMVLPIMIIPNVLADEVGIITGRGWVYINELEEIIKIEDRMLNVSVALNLGLDGVNRDAEYFEFSFLPERATERSREIDIAHFKVCKGRKGGHNYDFIPLNCDEELKSSLEAGYLTGRNYVYRIDASKIKDWEEVAISLSYTVPNFINKGGSLKTLRLTTECFASEQRPPCPFATNIDKHIILPVDSSLQGVPDIAEVQPRSDGSWRVTIDDFTPETSREPYSDILVSYIDNKQIEEEKYQDRIDNIILAVIVGLFTGILSTLIADGIFKRKEPKEIYFCKKCKRNHKPFGNIWKEHLIYK